ncbi:phosphatase PAP2 family protein [Lentzea sp. NPDC058450]|uniref:phosphatase PAP2 family protein n=1 Tax=Lentzea sp. NPDC058450 TaxID=3346505 RepID=UPI00365530B7
MTETQWFVSVGEWVQQEAWLQRPLVLFNEYGLVALGVVVLALLVWAARSGMPELVARALWVPASMAIAPTIGLVVKNVIAEPRPCRTVVNFPMLLPCEAPTDFSFPSNHTTIAAAFAVSLFLLNRRWGVAAVVFALAMAAARVLAGAHYPHDVLAGLLLGALIGACGVFMEPLLIAAVRRARLIRSEVG